MSVKMDRYNLIFEFVRDDLSTCSCYVPQPNMIELKALSRILAYFYSEIKKGYSDSKGNALFSDIDVMLVDYERYVEEALEPLNQTQQDAKLSQLDAFYERSFLGASFFDSEYIEINKKDLSEDEKERFKAMLLFTSALFRYLGKAGQKAYTNLLFTLSSVTEWVEYCKKQRKLSTQDKNTETTHKKRGRKPKEQETTLSVSVSSS